MITIYDNKTKTVRELFYSQHLSIKKDILMKLAIRLNNIHFIQSTIGSLECPLPCEWKIVYCNNIEDPNKVYIRLL